MPDLMKFPKPEPRARTKRRKLTAKQAKRRICVEAVWGRAHRRCETCKVPVRRPSEASTPFVIGHVHEIRPRSLGGDPTDPDLCVLLCPRCHAEAHRLRPSGASIVWKGSQ